MSAGIHAKVFWSGGSQAVRLPKAVRVTGKEVIVRKRGAELVIEQIAESDDWTGFWDSLVPLGDGVKRHPVLRSEKRKPL